MTTELGEKEDHLNGSTRDWYTDGNACGSFIMTAGVGGDQESNEQPHAKVLITTGVLMGLGIR